MRPAWLLTRVVAGLGAIASLAGILQLPVSLLLMEVGDFVMMRRCLLGIKRRAEEMAARR